MKNVCTVSDINYLTKGLALYESLIKHTDDVTLHYLCIDDVSYNKLKRYECDTLKVYNIKSYLDSDDKLNKLRVGEYKYFCWSLASYFTNKILVNYDSITYIDADIFFHKSFNIILSEISNREIGIFRHRQFPLTSNRPEGHYNVGVVHFKNTVMGRKLSNWWADAVLNKRYPEYATCGDQKYLEYFETVCSPDVLYIDDNIGHGAPWHWQTFELLGGGRIKFEGQEQELIFTHFSQFVDNGKTYVPSTMHHIYTPLVEYKTNQELKEIYDDYHSELTHVKLKYNG